MMSTPPGIDHDGSGGTVDDFLDGSPHSSKNLLYNGDTSDLYELDAPDE